MHAYIHTYIQPEDAAEWFKTVEWSCNTTLPRDMLTHVGKTLTTLALLDKQPDPDQLWASL